MIFALVLASPFLLAVVMLVRHLRRRGTIPGEVQHLPPPRSRTWMSPIKPRRCADCGCLWRRTDLGWSLYDAQQKPKRCCDNAPMPPDAPRRLPRMLAPLLVLGVLGAAFACVSYPSPAVVLQREAAGYKATLRQARARVLTAADLVRLDLCDRNVRLTDDAAHEGYPTVTAEARAAASLMRQSCAGAEKWGSAQNPVEPAPVAPQDPSAPTNG